MGKSVAMVDDCGCSGVDCCRMIDVGVVVGYANTRSKTKQLQWHILLCLNTVSPLIWYQESSSVANRLSIARTVTLEDASKFLVSPSFSMSFLYDAPPKLRRIWTMIPVQTIYFPSEKLMT